MKTLRKSWQYVCFALLGIMTFWRLPQTFFQQDEWLIFGRYLFWDKANLNIIQQLFLDLQVTHLIPFADVFSYLQYKFFGINFFPYAVMSIALHIINSFLIFYLALLLTKKRTVSFFAGMFFLVNSISHQAVTWIATTTGTVFSTSFLLLSLLFYAKFILNSPAKTKNLIIAFLMLVISLGFKETSLFLLLLYPVFWLLYAREDLWKGKKVMIAVFVMGFVYLLIRIFFAIFGQIMAFSLSGFSYPPLFAYGYRLIANPVKFFTQAFIPQDIMIRAAEIIVRLGYPRHVTGGVPDPFIVESVGVDIINLVGFIFLLGICYFFLVYFNRIKNYSMRNGIHLSVISILLSSLPLIFIPGRAGYFSLVDGRHLYVTSVFTSILFSILIYGFFRITRRLRVGFFVSLGLITLIFVLHIFNIRYAINEQMGTGFIRKSILKTITEQYPKLPSKVVFYIVSDKAYYGLPPEETILPFQSGFGQTLLVWYDAQGKNFPSCFFKDDFLYPLISEGYRECEGRGFGYYRNLNSLKEALKSNEFMKENVIGFSYTSYNNMLSDITNITKKEL